MTESTSQLQITTKCCLPGGALDGRKIVGIIINSKTLTSISDIVLSAIHCSYCFFRFDIRKLSTANHLRLLKYATTSLLNGTQTLHAYMVLLVKQAKDDPRFVLRCGDFNANTGDVIPNEDPASVGHVGVSPQTARGS